MNATSEVEERIELDFGVLTWRFDALQQAGYPADVAADLARLGTVDLHFACDLLQRGASLEQALRIIL